jgi:hypothetical protein
MDSVKSLFDEFDEYHFNLKYVDLKPFLLWQGVASDSGCTHGQAWPLGCLGVAVTFRFVSIACHAAQGAKVSAVTATGVFANVNELQLVETIDLSDF